MMRRGARENTEVGPRSSDTVPSFKDATRHTSETKESAGEENKPDVSRRVPATLVMLDA